MNKNLENARRNLNKIIGILYLMEKAAAEYEDMIELGIVFALKDAVTSLNEDIEQLEGDARIVDVIQAMKQQNIDNRK